MWQSRLDFCFVLLLAVSISLDPIGWIVKSEKSALCDRYYQTALTRLCARSIELIPSQFPDNLFEAIIIASSPGAKIITMLKLLTLDRVSKNASE